MSSETALFGIDMDEVIHGEKLTTFDIEPDGSRFCVRVADRTGFSRGLSLPAECLTQLIMTLPEMASRLLQIRYRDDSLRIVYPLGDMHIEATPTEERTIFTLATQDGFSVSFALTAGDLERFENTAREARTNPRPNFIKN
jgi:hypothetical protein